MHAAWITAYKKTTAIPGCPWDRWEAAPLQVPHWRRLFNCQPCNWSGLVCRLVMLQWTSNIQYIYWHYYNCLIQSKMHCYTRVHWRRLFLLDWKSHGDHQLSRINAPHHSIPLQICNRIHHLVSLRWWVVGPEWGTMQCMAAMDMIHFLMSHTYPLLSISSRRNQALCLGSSQDRQPGWQEQPSRGAKCGTPVQGNLCCRRCLVFHCSLYVR